MLELVLDALRATLPPFELTEHAVNCHHNYVAREHHFGAEVYVTRKGAIRAGAGELGIIPGSMGARSYIVRGKGVAESFSSCAHGAGRRMSRSQAKKAFNADDLARQTAGVECRKDAGVVDEIPAAYKGHRRGDGQSGRSGRGHAHPQAGRVREGVARDGRRLAPQTG